MIILGSTGTIGVRALEIAHRFGKEIEAIAAGKNIALLNQQIATYKPKKISIACKEDIDKLESSGAEVFVGASGICEMIQSCSSHLVLNAIVGFAGLAPSICAQKCGKKLALANKESLITGGWLLDRSNIMPIDSEHFGLWYLMNGFRKSNADFGTNDLNTQDFSQNCSQDFGVEKSSTKIFEANHHGTNPTQNLNQNLRQIKRLLITASGGAFRDTPLESMSHATKAQALKHPNWQMGQKITIDSATMANKLFEVLEAYWLFDISEVSAFIERSSTIHALIEFVDGSTTAHFALPSMSLPIAYAIDETQASESKILDSIDLSALGSLSFEAICPARYPLWELKDTLLANPKLAVVINAANEVAVLKFLRDEVVFGEIAKIVFSALDRFQSRVGRLKSYEDIAELDSQVRMFLLQNPKKQI